MYLKNLNTKISKKLFSNGKIGIFYILLLFRGKIKLVKEEKTLFLNN